MVDDAKIIAATRRWISSVVIGLNLCPFAQRVFLAERIRYAVTPAEDAQALLVALRSELMRLARCLPGDIETTLLIHPRVFSDFLDFNDFLDDAEQLLVELGLESVIQIASFHPRYQFAGSEPEDVENWTNRSPFPMLHLLREASITQVAQDEEELLRIPERNMETLRQLGKEAISALLNDAFNGDDQAEAE